MRTWYSFKRATTSGSANRVILSREIPQRAPRFLLSCFNRPQKPVPSKLTASPIQITHMPKKDFYAVRKGRKIGIFGDWPQCQEQVNGFPGSQYKKFPTYAEAVAFLKSGHVSQENSLKSGHVPQESSSRGKKRPLSSVYDESDCTVVYSDGACKGNGQPGAVAGVGVFWGTNDPRNIAERCPGDQTNNRAELIAITRTLETAPVTKKLLIKTDSQYSIKCFKEWLLNWRKNGYQTIDGAPVKNIGIIEYSSSLLDERGRRGQVVLLQYVKGHSGDPGNDGADALANLGTTLSPQQDLDWTTLKARADKTIQALVPAETCTTPTAAVSPGAIIPHNPESRPAKLSKGSNSVFRESVPTMSGQRETLIKPLATLTAPVLHYQPGVAGSTSKPTIYERHFHRVTPKPNPVPELIDSPSSTPFTITRPRTPPAKDLTPTAPMDIDSPHPTTTSRADTQSRHQRPNRQSKLPRSPRSPLKVSKVEPPLVPVSAHDIDLDLYKDCLLDGEEWEKEIQNL